MQVTVAQPRWAAGDGKKTEGSIGRRVKYLGRTADFCRQPISLTRQRYRRHQFRQFDLHLGQHCSAMRALLGVAHHVVPHRRSDHAFVNGSRPTFYLFDTEEPGCRCAHGRDGCCVARFGMDPFVRGVGVGHLGDRSSAPRVDARATTRSNKFPETDSHVQSP